MDAKDAPQIIEHLTQSVAYTPYDTKWIPCSAKFVALGVEAKGTGVLNIYELGKTELKTVSEARRDVGFKCGTFGASLLEHRHLATGNYKGQLEIWDLENLEQSIYCVKAHDTLVNCIDGIGGLNIGGGAPEIATGARDGKVCVWDPRQTDPVASLEPLEGQAPRDCWAVAFGHSYGEDERMLAAGYDNGDIKLLDLRMNKIFWETNVANGITGVEFDRKDIKMNKLLITTLENKFRIYDVRNMNSDGSFSFLTEKAHKSTVWTGKHLPQNREIFATTGGTGTINVYKYNYPKTRVIKDENGNTVGVPGTVTLLNSKKVADQPIISLDWHPDKTGLACLCALDQTIKVAIVTRLAGV